MYNFIVHFIFNCRFGLAILPGADWSTVKCINIPQSNTEFFQAFVDFEYVAMKFYQANTISSAIF